MTEHLITRFHQRALAAASASSPPPTSGSPSPASADQAGSVRAAEEACTACSIVRGEQPAYTVYEDEHTLAILDILPIRRGHLLVLPKRHYDRVPDMPDEVSAALGRVLPRISRALCRAIEQPDFNVVANNGYAQVIPHVHFHVVPAPSSAPSTNSAPASPSTHTSRRLFSFSDRTELEEADAVELVKRIRAELERASVVVRPGRRAKL